MYFDTDEVMQLAVNLAALKAGKTVSEFLSELVREQLNDSLVEAARIIQDRGAAPRPTRGRPRKSD